MEEAYRQHLVNGERAGARYVLNAPRIVPLGAAGDQLAKRAGSSLEFIDRREYQPGDDLRAIDWSGFARSDKLIVKLYRDEVSPHADIILDGSCSMNLEGTRKAEAALGLTAAFAAASFNAGYSASAWIAADGYRPVENGSSRPSIWDGIDFEYTGSPADSFRRAAPRWRPYGIRILISDLLWIGDPMETLSRIAERASAVVVVQMLAESDIATPERGNVRFVDSETEDMQEIFLDAGALARYRNALARHQERWHTACRQAGAVMTTATAEETASEWKLDALVKSEVLQVA